MKAAFRSGGGLGGFAGVAWPRGAVNILGEGLGELFPDYCEDEMAFAEAVGWEPDTAADYCGRCGASCHASARTARGCPFCIGRELAWGRLVRLGRYSAPIDRWVRVMKFRHRWLWGRRLGELLAQRLDPSTPAGRTIVCPVPMHFYRRWRRGYNQSQIMAEALARARGWPVADVLHRTRYTHPQTAVPTSQRHHNIRDSFAIRPVDLTGWHVWLTDDVTTTGATLTACAKLLNGCRAASVNVAVIAVADPRNADFKVAP